MDPIDQEPTITDIKDRIADLNKQIMFYKSEYGGQSLPAARQSNRPKLGTSASALQLREAIYNQISNIKILIDNVLPKMHDNIYEKNSSILPLLKKIQELRVTYAALVEEAKIPDYHRASNESTHIKANADFNQYAWYLLFMIFFLIAFFFILKNPESGNLDIFMLVLSGGVIVYYVYQYYDKWRRMK